MLLIFLSRAASSLLVGSFGLARFFSEGTSPARGWRWPTGASRTPVDGLAPGDPVPVCAVAEGPAISARSAKVAIDAVAIDLVVNSLRILLLPSCRETHHGFGG